MRPTAREIVRQIREHVGVPWSDDTVDTFKAGDPDTRVTGIAVTMMATLDVLQRAAAAGANLVITHEPTFYGHEDKTDALQAEHDPVYAAKDAFIREHRLVVWRFHDHWHRRTPDGVLTGVVRALGWQAYRERDPGVFEIPATSLEALASHIRGQLHAATLRVVGDPALPVTRVALSPGAAGFDQQRASLQRRDVQVLVVGEAREWETVEYAGDAALAGGKGLIVVGHIPSEQVGMDECATWLRTFITGVGIRFVPAADPFWSPR